MHSCGRGFIFQLPEENVIPLSKAFSALVNPDIIAAYELMIEVIMCLKGIFKELNKAYANINLLLKKVNVLDLGPNFIRKTDRHVYKELDNLADLFLKEKSYIPTIKGK